MQNETQKEIAGIQSATSRQNTKDQVYAQNEMLAYQQKESTARVASRSEERFSRNAETDIVCRLLLEKKKKQEDDDDTKVAHTVIALGYVCYTPRSALANGLTRQNWSTADSNEH